MNFMNDLIKAYMKMFLENRRGNAILLIDIQVYLLPV